MKLNKASFLPAANKRDCDIAQTCVINILTILRLTMVSIFMRESKDVAERAVVAM